MSKFIRCAHLPEGTRYFAIPISDEFKPYAIQYLRAEYRLLSDEWHECHMNESENITTIVIARQTLEGSIPSRPLDITS